MTAGRRKSTEFWLALLEFGNGEEERRQNWNLYCRLQFSKLLNRYILAEYRDEIWQRIPGRSYSGEDTDRFDILADRFGGHPQLVHDSSPPDKPFMDFTGEEFPDDVSFSGRGLFWADFSGSVFRERACFRGATFVGEAKFNEAKFHGIKPGLPGAACFSGSSFYGRVQFNAVQFPYTTKFDQVTFHDFATFQAAKFKPKIDRSQSQYGLVDFEQSQFTQDADFSAAVFDVDAEFQNVTFDSSAGFDKAAFRSSASFNNTKFRNTTSFRKASFGKPPKFFEAEIHEDVDFSKVDWSVAELCYDQRLRPSSIEYDAGNAVRAWDRLALIMSQQEKSTERHEFFRLKMRAQRRRDGSSLLSLANWIFDISSDYGWSVQRAFSWWAGHIAVGAVFLADGWPAVSNSLIVSFANSLAFLRLGSEGGYLYGPYETLMTTTSHAEWVINSIGAFHRLSSGSSFCSSCC